MSNQYTPPKSRTVIVEEYVPSPRKDFTIQLCENSLGIFMTVREENKSRTHSNTVIIPLEALAEVAESINQIALYAKKL